MPVNYAFSACVDLPALFTSIARHIGADDDSFVFSNHLQHRNRKIDALIQGRRFHHRVCISFIDRRRPLAANRRRRHQSFVGHPRPTTASFNDETLGQRQGRQLRRKLSIDIQLAQPGRHRSRAGRVNASSAGTKPSSPPSWRSEIAD